MKALLQSMYAMMTEAKMGQSAWGYSLIHAAYLLNISPRPGLTAADLSDMPDSRAEGGGDPRLAFTPQGSLLHVMPDISTVPVPLWSIGYIRREGAKPSQLAPCSDVGLFCGVAEGTIGFKLLRLSDLVCVSTYHVQFDQDLHNRPAVMAQHKGLLDTGGSDASSMHEALRALVTADPDLDYTRALVVYDQLTGRPIHLRSVDDDEYGLTLTEHRAVQPATDNEGGAAPALIKRRVRADFKGLLYDGDSQHLDLDDVDPILVDPADATPSPTHLDLRPSVVRERRASPIFHNASPPSAREPQELRHVALSSRRRHHEAPAGEGGGGGVGWGGNPAKNV